MSSITHNLAHWPIAITNVYGADHTPDELDAAYATWTSWMRRGKHVAIADLTRGTMAHRASQRRRLADWVATNEARLKSGRQLAHILVVDSALERSLITAIMWLKPPVNPQHVVRDMREAVRLAANILAQADVTIDANALVAARMAGSNAGREKAASGTRAAVAIKHATR